MKTVKFFFALINLTFALTTNAQQQTSLAELTGEKVSLWKALAIRNGHDLSNPESYPMDMFRREAAEYSRYLDELNYWYVPGKDNGVNNIKILHAAIFVDNEGFLTNEQGERQANLNNAFQAIVHGDINMIQSVKEINDRFDALEKKTAQNTEDIVALKKQSKKIESGLRAVEAQIDVQEEKIKNIENKIKEVESSITPFARFSYNSCECEKLTIEELEQVSKDFDNFDERFRNNKIFHITKLEKADYERCKKKVKEMLKNKKKFSEKGIYEDLKVER